MITVSRLDGKDFVLNALLIETIESVPDTVITLTTGRKYVVREPVEQIVRQAIEFYGRGCFRASAVPASGNGVQTG